MSVARLMIVIDEDTLTRASMEQVQINQAQLEVLDSDPYQANAVGFKTADLSITARQRQVLNYIAKGNSNKQISKTLGISEQTIKNHISNTLLRLNAKDRTHAVVIAMRNGFISMHDENDCSVAKKQSTLEASVQGR